VACPEGDILVVFYYLNSSESWPLIGVALYSSKSSKIIIKQYLQHTVLLVKALNSLSSFVEGLNQCFIISFC
jgi:hypothetical protein